MNPSPRLLKTHPRRGAWARAAAALLAASLFAGGKAPAQAPGDLPSSPEKNYQFGSEQVKRMLNDRIFMGIYPTTAGKWRTVSENDPVFIWLAKRFAPTPDGVILWNPDPPMAPTMGDNTRPTSTRIGYIRVRDVYLDGPQRGDYRSFEELWYTVIFEATSEGLGARWDDLYHRALRKDISRDDYIKSAARVEYDALALTKQFYNTVWLPWAKSVNLKSDPRLWYATQIPATFEEWFNAYTDHNDYPYKPFGEEFDALSTGTFINETKQKPPPQ